MCNAHSLFSLDYVKQYTGGGGGYSHILAIPVCAAGKGMVFKPFSLI